MIIQMSGRSIQTITKIYSLVSVILFFTHPVHASENNKVQFSSEPIHISPLRVKRAKELGKEIVRPAGVTLEGSISLPDSPPPFAAVILVHGCMVDSEWLIQWKQRLLEWGYAVLLFDAFSPRQVKTTCSDPYAVHPGQRARDIAGAVRFLADRNDMDPDRVGVMGLTHGAWSILYSLTTIAEEPGLSAAIVIFPLCGAFSQFHAPVWVLTGERRHGSDSYPCDKFLPKVPSNHEITLRTYPDSQHPMAMFEIDDNSFNNLTNMNSDQDHEFIKEIQLFLFKNLK